MSVNEKLAALEKTNQEVFELTGARLPSFRVSSARNSATLPSTPSTRPLPDIPSKPSASSSSLQKNRSLPPIPAHKPEKLLTRALPLVPTAAKPLPQLPPKPGNHGRQTIRLPRFDLSESGEAFRVTVTRCARCGEPLDSSGGLKAGDKSFHVACFKCFGCGQPLEHLEFYQLKTRTGPAEVCFDCYAASLPTCFSCHSNIVTKQYIQALGHTHHVEHFRCAGCSQILTTNDGTITYVEGDGLPWHKRCWQPIVRVKCRKCNEPLDNEDQTVIQFGESQFHERCFRCAHCKASLKEGLYWSTKQEGICRECKSLQVKQALA